MKFCRVTKYPPIHGGVSSAAYWLTKNLGENGHENFVITNANECGDWFKEEFEEEDYKSLQPAKTKLFNIFLDKKSLVPIPRFEPYTILLSSKMFEVLENEHVDMIEANYMVPYCVSAILYKKLKETRVPLVIRLAGSDTQYLLFKNEYKHCLRACLREADAIFVNTENQKKFVKENFQIDDEKIYIVGLPVDTKAFNPQAKPFDIGKFSKIYNPNKPLITFIGKITKGKGIREFLEAAREVKTEHQILFVGNGPSKDNLKEIVDNFGMTNRVFYANAQPPWRIPNIMAASTMVVSPQYKFPIKAHFSTVMKECMSVGKPILVSNEITGVENWVDEGKNGFVIDPGNKKDFTDKISYILDNPEQAKKIGIEARKKIEKKDDMKKYVHLYIEICRQIIEGLRYIESCDI